MILAEHDAKKLLAEAEIPVLPITFIDSLDHAKNEARTLGYPVVLKLSSSLHTHKTEVGGVHLNIRDEAGLEAAFSDLSELRQKLDPLAAIILEEMAPTAIELFVGIQRESSFGPVISLGMGGIWLELFRDVTFRLLPATRGDIREMIMELKCWPKLSRGFRHFPPANARILTDFLDRAADFALKRTDILEMDLNPVALYPERALALDARIVLES